MQVVESEEAFEPSAKEGPGSVFWEYLQQKKEDFTLGQTPPSGQMEKFMVEELKQLTKASKLTSATLYDAIVQKYNTSLQQKKRKLKKYGGSSKAF